MKFAAHCAFVAVLIALLVVVERCTPSSPRTFTCTVYIVDETTARSHPVALSGVGYIKGDTLVCKIK